MKVSIASLIYRSPYYADEVYKSILQHTPLLERDDYEFFFVANDATEAVLSHLKMNKYPHYVHTNEKRTNQELFQMGIAKPNYIHGVYRAWNKAIDLSKGEVVVLVNSDMMFSDGWLENLLKHVDSTKMVCSHLVQRKHPRMKGVFKGATHREFGGSPRNFQKEEFERFAKKFSSDNVSATKPDGAYMPCAIQKELLLRVDKFPEGNVAGNTFDDVREYGDVTLVRKLRGIGVKQITALDSLVYHFKEGEMDEEI